MKLLIVRVSSIMYVLVAEDNGYGKADFEIYSGLKSTPGDMIEIFRGKMLTCKLNRETSMLMYCRLARKVELTEEQWQYILPEAEVFVSQYFQPER